jgi:hypothetical protein
LSIVKKVIKLVKGILSHIRENAPGTFPNPCLGGKLNDTYEAYTTGLRNATMDILNSNDNGDSNRTRANGNRDRNYNKRPSVTITYDEEDFPKLTTPVTPTLSPPTRTPLNKPNRKSVSAVDPSKKDTYASRTAATNSIRASTTTHNETHNNNNNNSSEHRSDETTTPKQHSREVTENSTRIFFQNVNGISAANDFSAASERIQC